MSDKDSRMENVSIPPTPNVQIASHQNTQQAAGEGMGTIQCDKSVFKKIAARAAAKVDGVASVGGRSTLGEIFLFKEKDTGIDVTTSDDSFGISVGVTVTVFFDCNIYDVCTELQRTIRNDIETITNYSVNAVNVKVQDMEPRPPADHAAAPDAGEHKSE